jgi:hypothetical protein
MFLKKIPFFAGKVTTLSAIIQGRGSSFRFCKKESIETRAWNYSWLRK